MTEAEKKAFDEAREKRCANKEVQIFVNLKGQPLTQFASCQRQDAEAKVEEAKAVYGDALQIVYRRCTLFHATCGEAYLKVLYRAVRQ